CVSGGERGDSCLGERVWLSHHGEFLSECLSARGVQMGRGDVWSPGGEGSGQWDSVQRAGGAEGVAAVDRVPDYGGRDGRFLDDRWSGAYGQGWHEGDGAAGEGDEDRSLWQRAFRECGWFSRSRGRGGEDSWRVECVGAGDPGERCRT